MANDPKTGTIAPSIVDIPDWLLSWETLHGDNSNVGVKLKKLDEFKNKPIYQMIPLKSFKFLGQQFPSETYYCWPNGPSGAEKEMRTVSGVSELLAQELIAAQRRIFLAFAAQQTAPSEITENNFISWCKISSIIGWQARNGPHSNGTAIDIDSRTNPYVATGTVGGKCTGEAHDLLKTDIEKQSLFAPAIEAYERAFQLMFDQSLGSRMSGGRSSEPTDKIWDDIKTVSTAVSEYFKLAFMPSATNKLSTEIDIPPIDYGTHPPSSNPRWIFTAEAINENAIWPNFAFKYAIAKLFFAKGAAKWNNKEKELYDQIITDYPNVRMGMIAGSLKPKSPGSKSNLSYSTTQQATRDPCNGFMTLRKEIAVGMRTQQSLIAWGACDWSGESGDIMHFELKGDAKLGKLIPDTHPYAGTVCYTATAEKLT